MQSLKPTATSPIKPPSNFTPEQKERYEAAPGLNAMFEEKRNFLENRCTRRYMKGGFFGAGLGGGVTLGALFALRKYNIGHARTQLSRGSAIFLSGAAAALGFYHFAQRALRDCMLDTQAKYVDSRSSASDQRYSILGESNEVERQPRAQMANDYANYDRGQQMIHAKLKL